ENEASALPANDPSSGFTNSFYAQTTVSGDIINVFLQNIHSTTGYQFKGASGTFNLYKNGSSSSTVAGVLQDNGNTGGAGNASATPPTVNTTGTINLTNTAPTLPSIIVSYITPA